MNNKISKLNLVLAMLIFGTVGVARKYISLPSGTIAFARGMIGTAFIALVLLFTGRHGDWRVIKKKLPLLVLSGALIGFNWIFLFEAYNYVSVPIATLCYYMSPVFVILASPFVLGERLGMKRIACVILSLVGMLCVSGLFSSGDGAGDITGIIFGLAAALLYASVILLNKKLGDLPAMTKTSLQLLSASVVILPYLLITRGFSSPELFSTQNILLLLVIGIVHTGIAYTMYFGSVGNLNGQTVAIFSYIDPVFAIIISSLVFPEERMDIYGVIGAVLILISAVISELPEKNKT